MVVNGISVHADGSPLGLHERFYPGPGAKGDPS